MTKRKKWLKVGVMSLAIMLVHAPFVLADVPSTGTADFVPNEGEVDVFHPGEEDRVVIELIPPGTTRGLLAINWAPSLDFYHPFVFHEAQTVWNEPVRAYQNGVEIQTAPFVQVSDFRGTLSGWTLTVQQLYQFTAHNSFLGDHELRGAELRFHNGKHNTHNMYRDIHVSDTVEMIPGGGAVHVMSSSVGAGAGIHQAVFGSPEIMRQGTSLYTVPIKSDTKL